VSRAPRLLCVPQVRPSPRLLCVPGFPHRQCRVHGALFRFVLKLPWWHGTRDVDIPPGSPVPFLWILSESCAAAHSVLVMAIVAFSLNVFKLVLCTARTVFAVWSAASVRTSVCTFSTYCVCVVATSDTTLSRAGPDTPLFKQTRKIRSQCGQHSRLPLWKIANMISLTLSLTL
jgi:hypothetical protein